MSWQTKNRRQTKAKTGTSLIETAAGIIFLLPIFLFLIDVTALVLTQTSNDALAKHAARAAADVAYPSGSIKASTVVTEYAAASSNTLCSHALLISTTYTGSNNDNVTCVTQMTCNLPVQVPFRGADQVVFQASDTEPVVGQQAPAGGTTP